MGTGFILAYRQLSVLSSFHNSWSRHPSLMIFEMQKRGTRERVHGNQVAPGQSIELRLENAPDIAKVSNGLGFQALSRIRDKEGSESKGDQVGEFEGQLMTTGMMIRHDMNISPGLRRRRKKRRK